MNQITNISPLDGRYAEKCAELRDYFSEFGLMRERLHIEIQWLKLLSAAELFPNLSADALTHLDNMLQNFSVADAEAIKHIEATTNHDVKALEYFIKNKVGHHVELAKYMEFIHFACTSEDINNLAYGSLIKKVRVQCLLPVMDLLIAQISNLAHEYAQVPMLARTHGQPASPTTVGKEFANFVYRLRKERDHCAQVLIYGKINGAVGNFNAHQVAAPEVSWPKLAEQLVEELDLSWNPYTTQIEPHDSYAAFFHSLVRLNGILIDFNRDMWGYIALHYFQQRKVETEVGSSTMPHKVNPIDFENSEGNLGLANAILIFLANQLVTSRWQRDLVDSTLLRNVGVAIGHTLLGLKATLKGVQKLAINESVIQQDLNDHWEVLTEAIQTVMRRYGIPEPYEKLKALSRGARLDAQKIHGFIATLDLPKEVKERLLQLTPSNYIGIAAELAKEV